MEPKETPNLYEYMSPSELRAEMAKLIDQIPKSQLPSFRDGKDFEDRLLKRAGSDHREELLKKYDFLLQKARITPTYREELKGEFVHVYMFGHPEEVAIHTIGEEGTNGLWDSDFAQKEEFEYYFSMIDVMNEEWSSGKEDESIFQDIKKWEGEIIDFHGFLPQP